MPPRPEAILHLDPDALRAATFDDLRKLMRECGVSSIGIGDLDAAVKRLIERVGVSGVIE